MAVPYPPMVLSIILFMKIKHLQLNTSVLRSPEKIVQFILDNDIDVACLQEIAYPMEGTNP